MKKYAIYIVLAVLILSALACASTTPTPQKVGEATAVSGESKTEPTKAPAQAEPTKAPAKGEKYKIGDVVQIGDITLVVNKFSDAKPTEYFKPDAGKKFVVVDVTFENKGSKAATVSSMLQMTLKDDTGQAYNIDLGAQSASGGKSPDGELAAGEKLRGQIGYQVPADAKGFEFVFDASLFSSGKIFVELGQ